ncbi:MAG: hypothetical protein HY910_08995 [Desulfarculus sp.]|nr:hypothetical protein [Desulfarculus sp.]
MACQTQLRGDGSLEVKTKATNRGDEPATNLQAVVLNLPGAIPSHTHEVLPDGQSIELAATAPAAQASPGRYAAIVRLELQDLNQFPLSAMGYAYYYLGRDWASPLVVQAQPFKLEGAGQLDLLMTNTEQKDIEAVVRVFYPRELRGDQGPLTVRIPAQQSRDLSVGIAKLTGQDNAVYPVLVLAAYELDGLHTEKVTEVKVTLAAQDNVFQRTMPWWLAGLAALAAWVAYNQIRWRRRR